MKHLIVIAAVLGLGLSACDKMQTGGAKPSLKSDDDKTIYAIGVDMGTKLKQLQLSKNELSILKMGIDDGSGEGKPKVEPREFLPKVSELIRNRTKLFAEKEKKESEKFMKKAAGMANAKKTDSGLVMVETQAGTGEQPKETDRVKVNYHGTLRGGDVFDSTRERKQPASFRLDRVIPCWKEGVAMMKVGGKAELYCPPEIAYGDRGAPPRIPPGSALKFEVELLEIIKDEKKPAKKKK